MKTILFIHGRGSWMTRVLVIAESSFLADAILSNLAQETDLSVLRLTQPDPSMISQAIREECSVLILIEDGKSRGPFITANDLFEEYGCFRMITVSPYKHYLHICDIYEMPVSGMAQVVALARDFRAEYGRQGAE
jgi:hypothetical protein